MNINLNDIVRTAKPWSLAVTIDGTKYPVRRLSSADFKRLVELQTRPASEQQRFVAGLIDSKRAPALDNEQASALIGIVVAYYQETVIRKNFEAAQRAVTAE